jgi:poly(hydroxyalkanoate) depolymerase family esterase
MNPRHRDMREATRLTRAGQLADATALLQRLLRGETTPYGTFAVNSERAAASPKRVPPLIDLVPDRIEIAEARPSSDEGQLSGSGVRGSSARPAERTASAHMPDVLTRFIERINRLGPALGRMGPTHPASVRAPEILPDGAQFIAGSYSERAGTRAYKLYIPSGYHGQALPLIIMLHGCTQSPDDFAAGTRMNGLAEEHTCLVVYPAQSISANPSKCWNWFSRDDQQRDRGEPALIAGITRQVMRDYAADPRRVYIAGLSAGAAAAAIMGSAYPDLYAAIGVHSGLACGAASDLPSAFAAMRHGVSVTGRWQDLAEDAEQCRRIVPTIVFHGDRDTTVNPRNGDEVIAQSRGAVVAFADLRTRVENGQASGGHAYSRTLYVDGSGRAILEQWVVRDAGHAWSGGSLAGSYTDPLGPDASREMLRFFLEHVHPGTA